MKFLFSNELTVRFLIIHLFPDISPPPLPSGVPYKTSSSHALLPICISHPCLLVSSQRHRSFSLHLPPPPNPPLHRSGRGLSNGAKASLCIPRAAGTSGDMRPPHSFFFPSTTPQCRMATTLFFSPAFKQRIRCHSCQRSTLRCRRQLPSAPRGEKLHLTK